MIVIDASVVLEVLLRTQAAPRVEERLFNPPVSLHAPHLLDVEVAQVLRRYESRGELGEERGRQALADLVDMPITRYPHDLLLPRVWELRHNATAYDAVYLALAEALEIPLLTRDRALASVPGFHAEVEIL